jgi:hypothetical protein
MKKKHIIFLVLLLALSIFLSLFIRRSSKDAAEYVDISQSEMSAFIFVTKESETNHVLNIYLTPFLEFNAKEEIKEFSITNFNGHNDISQVLLVPPTTLPVDTSSRTFLFTVDENIVQDDIRYIADGIEYDVSDTVKSFNQINDKGEISPYFGIIVKNIGNVNYKEVIDDEESLDSNKYLKYSGVALSDLTTKIQFDVNIKFVNGREYKRTFKGLLDGEMFAQSSTPVIELEEVK